MHNPVQTLIIKSRLYFRRRHKSSLVYSAIILVVLFYFIVFQNLVFLQTSDSTSESSVITNPDHDSSIFTPVANLLGKLMFFKKKTVPFVKTDAAASIDNKPANQKPLAEPETIPQPIKVPEVKGDVRKPEIKNPEKIVEPVGKSDGNPVNNAGHTHKDNKEFGDVLDLGLQEISPSYPSNTPNTVPAENNWDDDLVAAPAPAPKANPSLNDLVDLSGLEEVISPKLKIKPKPKPHPVIKETSKELKRKKIGYKFFQDVFGVLHAGRPVIPMLRTYFSEERIYHARYDSLDPKNLIFSEWFLSRFIQVNDTELESMTSLHKYVIDNLPDTAPKGLYSGNGIVYVGGGKFNWLTLLSIKSIRALGSKLPIEILIPKADEYEAELCEKVFPSLGARCIYLPYELHDPKDVDDGFVLEKDSKTKFEFEGYQYKALAILLLSFENILLLDSDNIPVHSPDHLFKQDPFISNGFIVWPDFWKRATSPDYYKIAGLKVSEEDLLPIYDEISGSYKPAEYKADPKFLDAIPLHQRKGSVPDPTSESGQLMISKKTHTKALLLALYYNLYGPSHFYPLFSQGSDGEGDKETFLAATIATNKKYYQVAKFLNAFGYFNIRGEFEGTGMGQYDPVEDYQYSKVRSQLEGKSPEQEKKLKAKDPILANGPQILFVHANWPKLDPWELFIKRRIFNEKAERIRLYGTGMKLRTGSDFETVQWTHLYELLCEMKIEVDIYRMVDREDICKELKQHLDFLASTVDTLEK
ncbi:glycosyltransferase family 71 protein [Suhomyces tanzawaensis NRRL Y-17324]|uniref:Glycosyltransferase family 71 protein n=1 Tax=Suhomyces tanzawaensis NRRL Y-17324 TaxID=984487 RepID=A0A1E4SKI3_9ASCO|nr:glycosyltransferase family 71 protein [Suhomyces tanzawaensis NRRL Y-17324]ODV80019.1 glycosyltransferase family 71 protein [Suhomyces tanzawaensis NRRL Y-17324]